MEGNILFSRSSRTRISDNVRRDRYFFTFLYLGIVLWFFLFLVLSRVITQSNNTRVVQRETTTSTQVGVDANELESITNSSMYVPLDGSTSDSESYVTTESTYGGTSGVVWNEFRGAYTDYTTYQQDLAYYNSTNGGQ